jgi:hypothetical protein
MYKLKITSWPCWNDNGITLVNKDVHYPTRKLYSDMLFIIDTNMSNVVTNLNGIFYVDTIHRFGTALEENSIKLNLMYQSYYHLIYHPLFILASVQNEPDLTNYINDAEEVLDVSRWN